MMKTAKLFRVAQMSLKKLFYLLQIWLPRARRSIAPCCRCWEKGLSGQICTEAVPPLWYQVQALEISAFFNEDDKQCFGKCWGRISLHRSSLVKIMLEMHKAEDITLCMRDAAVRICNFMESPSGFVFICAFVEQDVLPWCVEGLE